MTTHRSDTIPTSQVSRLLPPEARNALVAASKVGTTGSNERNKAVDDAITHATLRFPEFFKLENLK
jgi:hypothetical protein